MSEHPPVQHCPCCGQRLVMRQRPHVDLTTDTLLYNTWAVHLTPSEAELLNMLLKQMPAVVMHDRLRMAVYGDQGGGHVDEDACIKVWLCRLRRVLKPTGLEIVTHYREGVSVRWGAEVRAA